MKSMIQSSPKYIIFPKDVIYYIGLQLGLGMFISFITLLISGILNNLFSCLLGSLLVVIPSLVYAITAFSQGIVVTPNLAITLHKRAMLIKFVINFILFILVILAYRNCNYLLLFINYIITQVCGWLILLKK